MRAVLISTYELGRQPFGLASPAAWLRRDGHEVTCLDLSRVKLPVPLIKTADLVAFFLPMHTATRLFALVADKVRELNPAAHLAAYGLYAPLNQELLRAHGVQTVLGGEFEEGLAALARSLAANETPPDAPAISLARQQFIAPNAPASRPSPPTRNSPSTAISAASATPKPAAAASTSAATAPSSPSTTAPSASSSATPYSKTSASQVASGAEHITFGDPDFFNGPGHAMPLVEALHREWPKLTYDVTIKVEHLLHQRALLPDLRRTGCLFITTAVESLDDAVLEKLAKGHTRADFIESLRLTRVAQIPLSPTFIPFHPWTTPESYRDFLRTLAELDLASHISSIQLAIRLLIPQGSLLLELPEVRDLVDPFDPIALCYPWRHPDPAVDALAKSVHSAIHKGGLRQATRPEIFREICTLAAAGPYPISRAPRAPPSPTSPNPGIVEPSPPKSSWLF